MGSINEEGKLDNHLLTVYLPNALEGHPRLHSAMDRALDKPFSSSSDVIRCIRFEEELQLFRAKRGLPPNASEASAYTQMAVTAKGKEKA